MDDFQTRFPNLNLMQTKSRCSHCVKLKPAWDKLMLEYRGHRDVLVGDCDCTGACKALCQEKGVQGYPTVMSGDPSAL